jgi:hypothetical protein
MAAQGDRDHVQAETKSERRRKRRKMSYGTRTGTQNTQDRETLKLIGKGQEEFV